MLLTIFALSLHLPGNLMERAMAAMRFLSTRPRADRYLAFTASANIFGDIK